MGKELYEGPNLAGLSKEERAKLVAGASGQANIAPSQRNNPKKIEEWPQSRPTTLAEQLRQGE